MYANVKKFIDDNWNFATQINREFGIPIESALAQGGIESAWGRAAPGNNLFGIKAHAGWKGKKQQLKTTEVINGKAVEIYDWFRVYDSRAESWKDWANFLKVNSRYKNAFNFSDPYKFSQEIAKAGYATDPDYYSKLQSTISGMIAYTTEKKKAANNSNTPG
jgi:peptidoglycan hydrolase FlgJ